MYELQNNSFYSCLGTGLYISNIINLFSEL